MEKNNFIKKEGIALNIKYFFSLYWKVESNLFKKLFFILLSIIAPVFNILSKGFFEIKPGLGMIIIALNILNLFFTWKTIKIYNGFVDVWEKNSKNLDVSANIIGLNSAFKLAQVMAIISGTSLIITASAWRSGLSETITATIFNIIAWACYFISLQFNNNTGIIIRNLKFLKFQLENDKRTS